ncbi:MAG TPA: hypothetical protein VFE78_03375 [Gemmataceae bacterium]|jgi:hypothetical protein|nr:hypothetical protein [Gemmataceae bacterium]
MSEFEQQPLEAPGAWLSRLARVDASRLPLEQQRAHAGYLAEARRLVQEEQQKARWARGR